MQLLTFEMQGVVFGIDVNYILSIEKKMNTVKVPNAPASVKGISDLHGEVIPIYDLASRFGYEGSDVQNTIVVGIGENKIGLEVERVHEITEIPVSDIVSMPDIMSGGEKVFPKVSHQEKDLVILVELHELIPMPEQAEIQELLVQQEAV